MFDRPYRFLLFSSNTFLQYFIIWFLIVVRQKVKGLDSVLVNELELAIQCDIYGIS